MLDYFVVILLVIIIFTFLRDKKILDIQKIKQNIPELEDKINSILQDIEVKSFKDIKSEQDLTNIQLCGSKYLIILDEKIKLTRREQKILIANYINEQEKVCGFNISYEYSRKNNNRKIKDKIKNIINKFKVIAINYVNIFSKQQLSSYGMVICKREEIFKILNSEFEYKKIQSFIPNEQVTIEIESVKLNKQILNTKKIDVGLILKALLLIVVGSVITTNIIYQIIMLLKTNTFNNNLITAALLYYCYTYVLNYLYRPIGRYKMISSYILPIYISVYIYIVIINVIKTE